MFTISGSEEEQKRLRVSIKFKVASGWRGTKSRDFPGRMFLPEERALLREWASDFRHGVLLSQVGKEKDLRIVNYPKNNSGCKRRKPYIGVSQASRSDAYHWFRSTQNRLLNTEEAGGSLSRRSSSSSSSVGNGSSSSSAGDLNQVTPPTTAITTATTMAGIATTTTTAATTKDDDDNIVMEELNSSTSISTAANVSSQMIAFAKIRSIYPPSIEEDGMREQFVEIDWGEAERITLELENQNLKTEKEKESTSKSKYPYRVHVLCYPVNNNNNMNNNNNNNSGHQVNTPRPLKLAVNLLEEGRGAYFFASDLLPGSYVINQCQFVVRPAAAQSKSTQNKILKKKSNKKNSTKRRRISKTSNDATAFRGNISSGPMYQNQDVASSSSSSSIIQNNKDSEQNDELAYSHELKLIERFKIILGDLLVSGPHASFREVVGDISLLRLLRGCQFDLVVGEELFRQHIIYREKYGMNAARLRITHQFNRHFTNLQREEGGHVTTSTLENDNESNNAAMSAAVHEYFMKWNQKDLIHGAEISKWLNSNVQNHNAGYDKRGNPINLMNNIGMHMVECLNELGPDKFFEHLIEAIVHRQIQLDLLSRRQNRLVKVVMVAVNCVSMSIWRFFVPGVHRNIFRARMDISSTMPNCLQSIHWICDSWATKAMYKSLNIWLPDNLRKLLQIHGGDYCVFLQNLVDNNMMATIESTRYNFARNNGGGVISHEFVKDGILLIAHNGKNNIANDIQSSPVIEQEEQRMSSNGAVPVTSSSSPTRPLFMYPTTGILKPPGVPSRPSPSFTKSRSGSLNALPSFLSLHPSTIPAPLAVLATSPIDNLPRRYGVHTFHFPSISSSGTPHFEIGIEIDPKLLRATVNTTEDTHNHSHSWHTKSLELPAVRSSV
jgi:hypothetical protein